MRIRPQAVPRTKSGGWILIGHGVVEDEGLGQVDGS